MARITVEDCLKEIPNRFHLVLEASKMARKLANGQREPMVARENHKDPVVALYEIAAGYRDSVQEEGL